MYAFTVADEVQYGFEVATNPGFDVPPARFDDAAYTIGFCEHAETIREGVCRLDG